MTSKLIVLILALVLAVVAAPLAAGAQQATKSPRIGYLTPSLTANPSLREAFRQGLRDLGYIEGRNVVIEYRDAEEKDDRLPALAAELVALKVDVIVTNSGTERRQHERPPRPRAPAPAPRPRAITPPAPHADPPLEPQAAVLPPASASHGRLAHRAAVILGRQRQPLEGQLERTRIVVESPWGSRGY